MAQSNFLLRTYLADGVFAAVTSRFPLSSTLSVQYNETDNLYFTAAILSKYY